jgi:uncharacterized protein with GYD domain
MIRLVTRGRFTHDYVKALIGAPEDREPAVRKLIEGVGGKVISFYMTTGDTDFLLISETDEAEAVIAALMASSAAGMISNVATVRAWTGAEFKSVADRVAKAAKSYRPPGKKH